MGDRKISGTRLALVGAGLALLAALAVALWVVIPERPISYTGSSTNPSLTAAIGARPVAERPAAPPLAFADADGHPRTLGEFRGKVVLVNLWATWCPPCVAEMPSIAELQRRLGGERFQVVAVALDRGGAPAVARWFHRNGIDALALYTGNPADYPDALLPTSLLVDAEGRVAWDGFGAKDWAGERAIATVEAVIEGR
ncbi:MAG: TlpA disulfide reductase family protein [Solirubrobacterales bacterium]